MKVSVETKGELERRISVTVPAAEVSTRYKEELSRAAKDVHLKGFRPGRAPASELERRFGRRFRREVALDVAREKWPEAAEQESLKPATAPRLELGDWQEGLDLHFHATFECMPEFDLIDFSALELVRPKAEVTDQDIDAVLDKMCQEQKVFEPSDGRESQMGDHLTVDFQLVDKDSDDVVNSQESVAQPVSDFSEDPYAVPPTTGLAGVRAGETHEFEWQVPEAYPGKEIAGRQLLVRYAILAVLEPVVPKPDDAEFLQRTGLESLEALRDAIRDSLERNRDQHVEGLMREQALRRLSDARDFSLPEGMVLDQMGRLAREREQYIEHLKKSLAFEGGTPGSELEDLKQDPQARSRAREYVKAALLLRKVIDTHDLSVTDDALEDEIRRRSQQGQDPQARFMEILENEDMVAAIEHELLQQAAMQYVVDRASVAEREESLQALLKRKAEDFAAGQNEAGEPPAASEQEENSQPEDQKD